MADRLEDVKPTRMALHEMRKKKVLAENGHDLLSEKKDALINEFFNVVDDRKDIKEELEELLEESYTALIEAQMVMGKNEVESIADGAEPMEGIPISSSNIMGVNVPELETEVPKKRFYGYAETSVKLDEAVDKFREALDLSLQLAEVEGKLDRLADEIEKAKRRVNSLEYNYIPKLEATITYIERQLEEREREDFVRRKKIKSMMEEEE